MPPNAKQVAGRARKEEAANKKASEHKAKEAAKEDAEWAVGAKGKSAKEDKAAKEEAARARKAEAARLLALEEASLPSKPKAAPPKAGAAKGGAAAKAASKPAPAAKVPSFESGLVDDEPTAFAASGIDDALDMLTLVSAKTDKAAVGAKASEIEQHPERRFKAAFEAYKEEQLPIMRKDFPGLRLQQYHDKLYKDFQKHPDNPFNQATLAYDATKADKVAALKQSRAAVAERLRTD